MPGTSWGGSSKRTKGKHRVSKNSMDNLIPIRDSKTAAELGRKGGSSKSPLKSMTCKINAMKALKCSSCVYNNQCPYFEQKSRCKMPQHLFKMLFIFSSYDEFRDDLTRDIIQMNLTKDLAKQNMKLGTDAKSEASLYLRKYYIDKDFSQVKKEFGELLFGTKQRVEQEVSGSLGFDLSEAMKIAMSVANEEEKKWRERKATQQKNSG